MSDHFEKNGRAGAAQTFLLLLAIALAIVGLYGGFLSSPPVFDDLSWFGEKATDPIGAVPSLNLRGLSMASFAWVGAAMRTDMVAQRLGNLLLHIVNSWLLFLFLLRLFNAALRDEEHGALDGVSQQPLSLPWLAFFGACWFALDPAAVYGVAYLVQRTTLMATLFALSTWFLFLEGLVRNQRRWLLLSSVAYFLAILSKEHAIMVPAVAVTLLLLFRRPSWQLLREVGLTFLLYGAVGIFTLVQIKFGGVVGNAYEAWGSAMLAELRIDERWAYPLSMLTQCFLYFKYLALWVVPYPGWMSVDMTARFAPSLWSWPEIAAVPLFLLYPVLAIRMLTARGRKGLFGFAMLAPWLLFATEFSTVRIQEIFVLYRSYLWMPCTAAAFPFLFRRVAARSAFVLFFVLAMLLISASWNRLTTFSDPLLLWDDARQLALGKDKTSRLGRIYHNLGVANIDMKRYQEAIPAFDAGLALWPYYSPLYNDRALAYFMVRRYQEALRDFNRAIMLDPTYFNPYLGRSQVYEALGNREAARQDYASSCRLGVIEVCSRAQ